MTDYMKEYKDLGKTPEGLRKFSRLLSSNKWYGGTVSECVLLSASDEIERLQNEVQALKELRSGETARVLRESGVGE